MVGYSLHVSDQGTKYTGTLIFYCGSLESITGASAAVRLLILGESTISGISFLKYDNVIIIASGVGLSPLNCGHFWPIVPKYDNVCYIPSKL
jgi:hypothetical protein